VGITKTLTTYAPSARQMKFGLEKSLSPAMLPQDLLPRSRFSFMSWWVYSAGEEEMLFLTFASFPSLGFHLVVKPRIGK